MFVFILKTLFALAGLAPYGELEDALLRFPGSDLGMLPVLSVGDEVQIKCALCPCSDFKN